MDTLFNNPEIKRLNIINELSLKESRRYLLSVAYIWLTKYCPVGCEHCMCSSPNLKLEHNYENILSKERLDAFIKMSWQSHLDTLIISGGGEPMLELEKTIRIIKEAHYNQIEIITSGYWTANKSYAIEILTLIQKAINHKKKHSTINFSFRISIDKYHQKKIKLNSIASLIKILKNDAVQEKRMFPDINLYFRALLIKDDTVSKLVKIIGASIIKENEVISIISFNESPLLIKVFYKDMRFIGRFTNRKETNVIKYDRYLSLYGYKKSDISLGATYIGPNYKNNKLNGINVFITYNGMIFLYGGVCDIYGELGPEGYYEFLKKIFSDPISRTLLERGLNYIKNIALEIDKNVENRAKKKNWIASIADESLKYPENRLYITYRLMQDLYKNKKIDIDLLSSRNKKIILMPKERIKRAYLKEIKLKIDTSREQLANEFVNIDATQKVN